MEKFDFTKDFTLADILSHDFYIYIKNYIKTLEEEQRICKRDRKTVNHPCADKRLYQPGYQLQWKIEANRLQLHSWNKIIYFLKKNYNLNNFNSIIFIHKGSGLHNYMNYLDEDFLNARKFRYIGYVNIKLLYDLFRKYNA